jgi:hypothetical protein
MRQNRLKYRLNYEKSLGGDFVDWAISEIRANRMEVIRWDDGGDCYSARYVRKLYQICKATPGTIHYLYTRCWQRPEILQGLLGLTRLPNVWMWFSFDGSMPVPPRYPRVRLCYLADGGESPPVMVDRIFPLLPRNLKKGATISHPVFVNGPVCRYKSGEHTGITCNTCPTACWKSPVEDLTMPPMNHEMNPKVEPTLSLPIVRIAPGANGKVSPGAGPKLLSGFPGYRLPLLLSHQILAEIKRFCDVHPVDRMIPHVAHHEGTGGDQVQLQLHPVAEVQRDLLFAARNRLCGTDRSIAMDLPRR